MFRPVKILRHISKCINPATYILFEQIHSKKVLMNPKKGISYKDSVFPSSWEPEKAAGYARKEEERGIMKQSKSNTFLTLLCTTVYYCPTALLTTKLY